MIRASVDRLVGWAVALSTGSLVITGQIMLVLYLTGHPGRLPAAAAVPYFFDVPPALSFVVVSTVILRRLPRHPIGWLFALLAAETGMSVFTDAYAVFGLPATEWVLWIWCVLGGGPTFFGLAMALLLFPTGRPASPRWRWLVRILWLYVGAVALVSAVSPWPNRIAFVDLQVQRYLGWPHENPLIWNGQGWLSGAYAMEAPVGAVLLLAALLSLVLRWRASTGDERQQIKWLGLAGLLFGLAIVLGLTKAISPATPEHDPAQQLLGQAIFTLIATALPVAIGLGIVRYRLYDIDLIVSKTIVFGGLVAFIGLAYVVGVVVVGQLLGRAGTTLPVLAATAVVATAFQPLRTWLQSRADRWVFGERAAPYELMTRYGREMGQALASSQVLERIAETAAQALRASSARVTTILPGGEVRSADWPTSDASPPSFDIVTLVYDRGSAIGEIAVAGAEVRPANAALLQQIASVTAAALRNVRLLAELEALHAKLQRQNEEIALSKSRLEAAAAAQRLKLENVVAQRLGPDLDILRDALPGLCADGGDRPDTVAPRCERLVGHAIRLVDEMRALSRGVLPSVLADHGLVAAFRAKLRRLDHDIRLEVDPSIIGCRFPAHVETTVYLCCQAAIDAVAADSGNVSAALRLSRNDGVLTFSFTHGAHDVWSEDLAASRDRITTLGGELNIHRDGWLTTITGTMPLDHETGQGRSAPLGAPAW